MLKKFGMVTVGVTAGLLAVAPLASASECHDHDRGHDRGHHKSHDGRDGNVGGDQRGTGNIQCGNKSGDLENPARGEGAIGIGQVAGPVLSDNAGNILSCNSFLNHNLDDNDVAVSVLGNALT